MTELKLNLSSDTIKKLRVLAILSDKPFAEVEQDLVQHFDHMISDLCMQKMAELNGVDVQEAAPRRSGFSQALQAASATPTVAYNDTDESYVMEDSISGHQVSHEAEEVETKSLAEEYEEKLAADPDGIVPFNIKAPKALDDEDFLPDAPVVPESNSMAPARKAGSFNPKKPRVIIGNYED